MTSDVMQCIGDEFAQTLDSEVDVLWLSVTQLLQTLPKSGQDKQIKDKSAWAQGRKCVSHMKGPLQIRTMIYKVHLTSCLTFQD